MGSEMDEFHVKAEKSIEREDYANTISYYTQIINTAPTITACLAIGKAFLHERQYKKAELSFNNALSCRLNIEVSKERDEEHLFDILMHRSLARLHQNQMEESVSDLEHLLTHLKTPELRAQVEKALEERRSTRIPSSLTERDDEKTRFVTLYRKGAQIAPHDTWHVVSTSWFAKWQGYTGFTDRRGHEDFPFEFIEEFPSSDPEEIDNSNIIHNPKDISVLKDPENPSNEILLKTGLQENLDYVLIPHEAFQFLIEKYSCEYSITRYPIETSDSVYHIEVYLKKLEIAIVSDKVERCILQISRKDTVNDLKRKVSKIKQLQGEIRAWKITNTSISERKLNVLVKAKRTVYLEGGETLADSLVLECAEITEDTILLLDSDTSRLAKKQGHSEKSCSYCYAETKLNVKCRNCQVRYCSKLCREENQLEHKTNCLKRRNPLLGCFCLKKNSSAEIRGKDIYLPLHKRITPPAAYQATGKMSSGMTGLKNLGNTCFMNSALQCLSYTTELTSYFRERIFTQDINKSNPLGTRGKLVNAYADIIQALWSNRFESISPEKLKKTLCTVAPQFSGYQQHDAHELLCALIGGLHEDLNSVTKKPYYPDNELRGMSDSEKAGVLWNRSLSRDQSIIVNLFYGQYKSTVQCPRCQRYSHTFDPFNSISLPLPVARIQALPMKFIYYDPKATPIYFTCEGVFNDIGDLRVFLADKLDIESRKMIFIIGSDNSMKEILEDSKRTDSLSFSTIYIYEIKEKHYYDHAPIEIQITRSGRIYRVAYPRLALMRENTNFKKLHLKIFSKIRPFLNKIPVKQDKQALYTEFVQDKLYSLNFVANRVDNCGACMRRDCRGCPVPYTKQLLTSIKSESLVKIELRLTNNAQQLGTRITDLNRFLRFIIEKTTKSQLSIDISECFRAFNTPEKLDKDNEWYCNNCKTHVQAMKRLEIYRVPSILIIQLKRFKVHGYSRDKISASVEFQKEGLDISEFVIGEDSGLYDLYAVCNHYGGLGGGHYTADCYDVGSANWIEFNDSTVSPSKGISHSSAYILFYRKRV